MDETPAALPGRCTGITVQKKRSNRISLYIDGDFAGGFCYNVIQKAGIREGDLITEKCYELLQQEECRTRLKDQIYRWLAVRNHSTGEIHVKSKQKGYTSDDIAEVTQELIETRMLDDTLFARQFAESKALSNGWGPVKIRMALSQKGLKKQYIDKALKTVFPKEAEYDLLIDAARGAGKKLMRVEPGFKRKKKLAEFLIRRGFPGSLVFEKADEVLKMLVNEET